MIKNRVCVQKSICGLLVVAMLMTGVPAYAAPGFTSLRDIDRTAQVNQEETAKEKVKPVIGGLSVVVCPGCEAGQKLQLAFDKAAFLKSIAQLAKDYALQIVMQKIQERTGLNLVTGFQNLNKKLDEKLGFVVDTTAAATQAQIAADAAVQDVANIQALALAGAEKAAEVVEKTEGVSKLCYAAEDTGTIAKGGIAGDTRVTGPGTVTDRPGGKSRHVFTARTGDTFARFKKGTKDKDGKITPPTSSDVAAAVSNRQNDASALAASNTTGSNGAQGPIFYRRDQADAFMNHYISKNSFFGAVEAAGIEVKEDAELTAGLDTRAADLLSSGGPQLSLLCFKEAASGKFILDGFDAAFCGKQYNWETAVETGYKIKETAEIKTPEIQPMDKVIDLATAYVIRDYIVPPPFSSFTPQFLKALADDKNYGAAEVLAKRQAFNNAASIVAGIYNKRIADITPQPLGEKDLAEFANNWHAVYPGTAVPPLPSKKARLDIAAERFRTQKYTAGLFTSGAAAEAATAAAMSVGLQKDILYSLERIELLLATMLSNDLQDRRGAIEQQINAANSATR